MLEALGLGLSHAVPFQVRVEVDGTEEEVILDDARGPMVMEPDGSAKAAVSYGRRCVLLIRSWMRPGSWI